MIEPMTIEVVYTAESTATGGGRDGHVKSSDGKIDLDTRPPKEAGGSGEGVNPELLFSAGYSACFLGALRLVARNDDVRLDDASAAQVTVSIGFGPEGDSYAITADIEVAIPGLDLAQVQELAEGAHQVCPYSKATRGNVPATVKAVAAAA